MMQAQEDRTIGLTASADRLCAPAETAQYIVSKSSHFTHILLMAAGQNPPRYIVPKLIRKRPCGGIMPFNPMHARGTLPGRLFHTNTVRGASDGAKSRTSSEG